MSNKDQLQTIDPTDLAQVSGGTATPATTSNDDVLTALTGILNSLQSITKQSNTGGGFNSQEMFMLMMVLNERNRETSVPWAWGGQPIYYY